LSTFVITKITYASIMIMISLVASTFYFLRPLRQVEHNIDADKYLSLFFLLFATAFVVFSLTLTRQNTLLVVINNTLFLMAFAYLKAAFKSRHPKQKRILLEKPILLVLLICTSINLCLFHFVDKSQLARMIVTMFAINIILFTIIPYIARTPKQPSSGEKLAINSIKLTMLILSILIIAILVLNNQIHYLFAITIAITLVIMILFGSTLIMFLSEVADLYQKESSIDFLTGLLNRRHFFVNSDQIVKMAKREGFEVAVIMGDIDDFKFINDVFGHDLGDQVIANFASIIKKLTRDTDITARFGGEEFCLLLPYTDQKGANELAERIRLEIMQTIIPSHICDVRYTASFGVATFDKSEPLNTTIIHSDRALYFAKEHGKNQVKQFTEDLMLNQERLE